LEAAVHLISSETETERSSALARSALARTVQARIGTQLDVEDVVPGVSLFRRVTLSGPISAPYHPSVSIVVRGRKRVLLGDEVYVYDQGQFLLTSVDLPTISEVLKASEASPYLSILMRLDLDMVREMMAELGILPDDRPGEQAGIAVGTASAQLYDAMNRLLDLAERPGEMQVMGGLIQREIIFRILQSSASGRLRQIASLGTGSNRVARAISWLRENFDRPIKIEDLAREAHMGVSTLHHHFRQITAMSPLQYQKVLRLHTARRLMLNDGLDAGIAGLRVGYESVTQFSREYRRHFGAPPARDIRALRNSGIESLVA
jgi:AraC-like DNA-binding protein